MNILNMVYSLRFFSSKCNLFHNSNVFGSCIIHILYTGCAKIKKNNSAAKRLTRTIPRLLSVGHQHNLCSPLLLMMNVLLYARSQNVAKNDGLCLWRLSLRLPLNPVLVKMSLSNMAPILGDTRKMSLSNMAPILGDTQIRASL